MNSSGMPEDISLDAYMRLPVEQYYILDPSQIQFLSGNMFVLSVPRINLLTATLQPVIQIQVTSASDAVILQAVDCQLNATGILGDLDSKFAMQFTTRLTWNSQAGSQAPQQQPLQHRSHDVRPQQHVQLQQQQQQAVQHDGQHDSSPADAVSSSNGSSTALSATAGHLRSGWNKLRSSMRGSSNSSGTGADSSQGRSPAARQPSSTPGSITGSGSVQVWCEVVPPFHLMPREVLERSCNVVISGLVNSLLPWFMRQLAADYQKWAVDEQYRATRRQRTVVKQQQQQQQQRAPQ
jgi:hypothetical protein